MPARAALPLIALRIRSVRPLSPGMREGLLVAALAVLCAVTYLPAVNNGFISDDFIMLEYVEQWRADFGFLFRIAPDVFRITSYVVLRIFMWAFGYSSAPLYAFVILVHFVNCVLLFRLCRLLSGDFRIAAAAALLFSVTQNAQEAVMWLAAMAYALGGFCILASLVFWQRGRYGASSIFFLVGLFSTESVLVLLLLVPLTDSWVSGHMRWRRQYLFLLAPPLVLAAVFVATLPSHHMVHEGLYAFGWHALVVFGRSLFRLVFPWVLSLILILGILERRLVLREVFPAIVWMCITLSPFVFLTYQAYVPSRHNYVPVMGLALALAGLLVGARSRRLAAVLMAMVMVANISYIWVRKDAQYEQRAAPTTKLLEELRRRRPERILVEDFPLNPWMARMCARHVPGWQPHLIQVNGPVDSCATCPAFRWVEAGGRYEIILPGDRQDAGSVRAASAHVVGHDFPRKP